MQWLSSNRERLNCPWLLLNKARLSLCDDFVDLVSYFFRVVTEKTRNEDVARSVFEAHHSGGIVDAQAGAEHFQQI